MWHLITYWYFCLARNACCHKVERCCKHKNKHIKSRRKTEHIRAEQQTANKTHSPVSAGRLRGDELLGTIQKLCRPAAPGQVVSGCRLGCVRLRRPPVALERCTGAVGTRRRKARPKTYCRKHNRFLASYGEYWGFF